jgi:hypothetical protein
MPMTRQPVLEVVDVDVWGKLLMITNIFQPGVANQLLWNKMIHACVN